MNWNLVTSIFGSVIVSMKSFSNATAEMEASGMFDEDDVWDHRAKRKRKQAQDDDETWQSALDDSMDVSINAFLNVTWAINRRDISTTLNKSCKKLLSDATLPYRQRSRRARALRILGEEFHKVGKRIEEETSGSNKFNDEETQKRTSAETRERAERAFMASLAKVSNEALC